MSKHKLIAERQLAALAKLFRVKSGKSKADIAHKLGAARPSIQQAEENPEQSLTKLRIRIIEACSPFTVSGPSYVLKRKKGANRRGYHQLGKSN